MYLAALEDGDGDQQPRRSSKGDCIEAVHEVADEICEGLTQFSYQRLAVDSA